MTEKLDIALTDARAEAARLGTILGGMSEGVLAVDGDERISFLNRAAREILGLPGVVEGTRLYELLREPHILGLVQAVSSGDQPVEAEISQEGPPRRLIQVYAARAGGDVILVLRDVSRMRRLERMRTDFVSNVSHELRTPLATIAASVETLEDESVRTDPDTADRFIGMLRRNVTRLEALLDDILALSRFESRPETLHRAPLDLAALTRASADELKDLAARGNVALTIEASQRVRVDGDGEALRRVVDNLIVNAITYTPEGGDVAVTLTEERGHAVLTVKDTGIGIAGAEIERIFERFYRIDKGRSRSAGGPGSAWRSSSTRSGSTAAGSTWPANQARAQLSPSISPCMRTRSHDQALLRELEQLKREVMVMGGCAEAALATAIRAFLERDEAAAAGVIEGDREVNALELRIEEECLKVLSLYGPTAKDLRFVVGVFKITNDLERMGDLAVNIAERAQHAGTDEPHYEEKGLQAMAEIVRGMVSEALESFVDQDEGRARKVLEMDDGVDDLLETVYQHQAGVVAKDGARFKPALRELAVAKYLERAADHSTNIAEDVVYMATGEVLKHQH